MKAKAKNKRMRAILPNAEEEYRVKYEGNADEQPVYICVDWKDKTVSIKYEPSDWDEMDHSDYWNGNIWTCYVLDKKLLTLEEAQKLVKEAAAIAEEVVDLHFFKDCKKLGCWITDWKDRQESISALERIYSLTDPAYDKWLRGVKPKIKRRGE